MTSRDLKFTLTSLQTLRNALEIQNFKSCEKKFHNCSVYLGSCVEPTYLIPAKSIKSD